MGMAVHQSAVLQLSWGGYVYSICTSSNIQWRDNFQLSLALLAPLCSQHATMTTTPDLLP